MGMGAIAPIAAAGAMGGLMGLFGTPDYSGAADDYANTMNQLAASYNPYINQGFMAKKGMAGLGALNMIAPAALQNRLAASYTNSPYQDQIQRNTANMMDMNAARTGMLGSTAEDAALQNQLANQQNQWQQQYIDRGMHQYDMGEQNLMGLGNLMANQGFMGTANQNMMRQQAALAQLQAAMMPTGSQNMFNDAMGTMIGML